MGRRSKHEETAAGIITVDSEDKPADEGLKPLVSWPALSDEDPEFVGIVRKLVVRLARREAPEWVYAIRVDKWFGPDWLGFKGKVLGRLGVHGRREPPLVVPAFHPHRVVTEHVFRRIAETYVPTEAAPLHRKQPSGDNVTNRLANTTTSGRFVWWSGDTRAHDEASILVYGISGDAQESWYVELRRVSGGWRFYTGSGLTKGEFEAVLGGPFPS